MSGTSLVLDRFPVEEQLRSPDGLRAFRMSYDQLSSFIRNVELQACLHEAAARGWISLPFRRPGRFAPVPLPGRPLSELLREVRD